ncbi:MAG: acyltransferase [Hyphomicrobiales bacterium]
MPHQSTTPSAPRKGQLVSLQYLRAAAAMMIVFTHGWDQLPWLKERLPDIFQSGVDLFFVISGFIMVYVTAKAGSSALHFFKMRVVRIVPLYWLYTFATAALVLALPQLFKTTEFTVPHFIQSLLFIPHWGPSGSLSPLILLGWTLNYEMFFYATFAIAMALSASRRVPLTIGMLLIMPILAVFVDFTGSAAGEFYSNDIVLEFMFGMLLAPLFLNGYLDRVGVLGGATLVTAGFVGLCIGGHHLDQVRVLIFGIPAALIVAGALSIEATRRVEKAQPFLLLGDASYSIYLAHMFPSRCFASAGTRLAYLSMVLAPLWSLWRSRFSAAPWPASRPTFSWRSPCSTSCGASAACRSRSCSRRERRPAAVLFARVGGNYARAVNARRAAARSSGDCCR